MSDDILRSLHGGATPSTFIFARQLRSQMTPAEVLVWNELKGKKLGHKFRRQHPFGKYILDFYCHSLRLSIEIDGGIHQVYEQKKYDKFRTEELERFNIKELRYANEMVENNLDLVIMDIISEINRMSNGH